MLHANGKYTRHEQKSLNLHGYGGKKERTWLLLKISQQKSLIHISAFYLKCLAVLYLLLLFLYITEHIPPRI